MVEGQASNFNSSILFGQDLEMLRLRFSQFEVMISKLKNQSEEAEMDENILTYADELKVYTSNLYLRYISLAKIAKLKDKDKKEIETFKKKILDATHTGTLRENTEQFIVLLGEFYDTRIAPLRVYDESTSSFSG